eukprot:6602990-Pyramimonas_sp.AAC.1
MWTLRADVLPLRADMWTLRAGVWTLRADVWTLRVLMCGRYAGSQLSLRGPDGSVQKAADNMFKERNNIFRFFALGVISLYFAGASGGTLRGGVWYM